MPNLSFSREPALYIAGANAVLFLAVSFGVPITADQRNAIIGLIGAVMAIVAGVVIRSQVTPVSGLPVAVVPADPLLPPHG